MSQSRQPPKSLKPEDQANIEVLVTSTTRIFVAVKWVIETVTQFAHLFMDVQEAESLRASAEGSMTLRDSSPSSSEISDDAMDEPWSWGLAGLLGCTVLPPSTIAGLPLLRHLPARAQSISDTLVCKP